MPVECCAGVEFREEELYSAGKLRKKKTILRWVLNIEPVGEEWKTECSTQREGTTWQIHRGNSCAKCTGINKNVSTQFPCTQACPWAMSLKKSPAKIPAAQVFPKLFQVLKYTCNVQFTQTHFQAGKNFSPKRNLKEKIYTVPKCIKNRAVSHHAGHT